MSQELIEAFERAIEADTQAASLDRITARSCTSDRFDGVQYNVYGGFVPIRPIIDVVAERDGIAIEQFFHCTDAEEPYLGVFVVEVPKQPHPAFV